MGKAYNEGKAQADLLASDFFNNFGSEDVKVKFDNQIEELIGEFAQKTVEEITRSIEDKGLNATRTLTSSVDYDTIQSANEVYKLKFLMADYWEDVENGQPKGTVVSVDDLMTWITYKPIRVRISKKQSKQSVLAKRKSMAIAISKSIKKKGTIKRFGYKGSNFLSEVIDDERLLDLSRLIAELTGKMTAYTIKGTFEKNNI